MSTHNNSRENRISQKSYHKLDTNIKIEIYKYDLTLFEYNMSFRREKEIFGLRY